MRSGGDIAAEANAAFKDAQTKSKSTEPRGARRTLPPLTLRLTEGERARLEDLAAGMTLSTYVPACVFGEEAKRRKRRPKDAVADKKAIAEALALLGQSRIANNLNQLAYHANIGALEMGAKEREQIEDAYAHVVAMRTLLVSALGKGASAFPGSTETDNAASRDARTRNRSHFSKEDSRRRGT